MNTYCRTECALALYCTRSRAQMAAQQLLYMRITYVHMYHVHCTEELCLHACSINSHIQYSS